MILTEYLSTFFLLEPPAGGWPRHFHIITAHNPGQFVSDVINDGADERLRRELNLAGSRCFRVTGCSSDFKHREPGWGIAGISLEHALGIARRYGQNALFEVIDGSLWVIGCLSEERIRVDTWRNRVVSTECNDLSPDFANLWELVSSQFPLGGDSDHGPDHWKRVDKNGLLLAADSGADLVVVRLFALFHDSRRENEFTDPDHGRRGAAYARELHGTHFQISEARLELLDFACTWHTETKHHSDPTIGTCWDADRLDLGRVGIVPDPKHMNTDLGRQLAMRIEKK